MKKVMFFVPSILFVLLAAFFYYALEVRKYKPVNELSSALIDRPFPEFQLNSLFGNQPLNNMNLVTGEVTLVNVWASWCGACRIEHPYLKYLRNQGVRIVGVNYKDTEQMAKQWLQQYGDVAEFHIVDRDGRLGINLGVYGAPETYLIDASGFIRYKRVGVLDERIWKQIEPLYQRLKREADNARS